MTKMLGVSETEAMAKSHGRRYVSESLDTSACLAMEAWTPNDSGRVKSVGMRKTPISGSIIG